MTPIILYSHPGGKSDRVAEQVATVLKCPRSTVDTVPELEPFDTVIMVMPITGDEELHPKIEAFMLQLPPTPKQYCICELGNFLGLRYDGCRGIAERIFNEAGWQKLSCVSIDSLPELDTDTFERWIDELKSL